MMTHAPYVDSIDDTDISKLAIELDQDHILCPISQEVMRYPIRIFPSKYNFELEVLITSIKRFGLICPITRKPITAFESNSALKKILDARYKDSEERYANYDATSSLEELTKRVYGNSPIAESIFRGSILTGISLFIQSTLFADLEQEGGLSLSIGLLAALGSYGYHYLQQPDFIKALKNTTFFKNIFILEKNTCTAFSREEQKQQLLDAAVTKFSTPAFK